jgi:vacuolar-type H+-ATPase subunit H
MSILDSVKNVFEEAETKAEELLHSAEDSTGSETQTLIDEVKANISKVKAEIVADIPAPIQEAVAIAKTTFSVVHVIGSQIATSEFTTLDAAKEHAATLTGDVVAVTDPSGAEVK